MHTQKQVHAIADDLSASGKAVLLERGTPAPLSFCRGSDECERLGLMSADGEVSELGRAVTARLYHVERMIELDIYVPGEN